MKTMADAAHAKPHHDYHLVNPSPWPALGATGAFLAAVGAILWMHHSAAYAPIVFGAGVVLIAYTMFSWWRDVIYEAEVEHDHTRVVQISHRYGMILFIASEVMFFVAWFWAYFNTALFPDQFEDVARIAFTGGVWPPKGIETFDPWHFPLLNTLILLTSGTTVSLSPACRPGNMPTPRSTFPATCTAPRSSWRPASMAPMSSSARPS
jgi:cytochrome c oxidase subunit 3